MNGTTALQKVASRNPFYRSGTNKRFSCSQLSRIVRREESLDVFCLPALPLLKVLLCGSKEEISLGFMKMNGGFSRYYVFAFKAAARDWSHTVFMERSRQRSERNKGRVENFSGKFDSHSLAALLQRAMS